jgi:hypothetical protein
MGHSLRYVWLLVDAADCHHDVGLVDATAGGTLLRGSEWYLIRSTVTSTASVSCRWRLAASLRCRCDAAACWQWRNSVL